MLRIGIGGYGDALGGRSMLASEAFFPFGKIVAADIVRKQVLQGGSRIAQQLDQSSAGDLAAVAREEGPFDIISDDGSHFNAHQIFSFEHLWPVIKDGGVYVIEDAQTSFWSATVARTSWDATCTGSAAFRGTCYGQFLELFNSVTCAEFLDQDSVDEEPPTLEREMVNIAFEHNQIILWKGDNPERSIFARTEQARALCNA